MHVLRRTNTSNFKQKFNVAHGAVLQAAPIDFHQRSNRLSHRHGISDQPFIDAADFDEFHVEPALLLMFAALERAEEDYDENMFDDDSLSDQS